MLNLIGLGYKQQQTQQQQQQQQQQKGQIKWKFEKYKTPWTTVKEANHRNLKLRSTGLPLTWNLLGG